MKRGIQLLCMLVPGLWGCYQVPEMNLDNPVNPNTPENWYRYKYEDISGGNVIYLNFSNHSFLHIDEKLYIAVGSGQLISLTDDSDITIESIPGFYSDNPHLIQNSQGEIFIYTESKLKKRLANEWDDISLSITQYDYWGEPYISTDFSHYSVIFDRHDQFWFISNYNKIFRQIPGSLNCEELPSYEAEELFRVGDDVWMFNSGNFYVYDEVESIFQHEFSISSTYDALFMAEHNGSIYLLTYYGMYEYSNNIIREISVDISDYSGSNFSFDCLDFDHMGNILINTHQIPIIMSGEEFNEKDPYYEDDYSLFLHLGDNWHLIFGTNAVYFNRI